MQKSIFLLFICFDLLSKSFIFFPVTVFWDPWGFQVFGTADVKFRDPLERSEGVWAGKDSIICESVTTVSSRCPCVRRCSRSSTITFRPRKWSGVPRSLTEEPLQNVPLPYALWGEEDEVIAVVLTFYRTFFISSILCDSLLSRCNDSLCTLFTVLIYIMIKKYWNRYIVSVLWLVIFYMWNM